MPQMFGISQGAYEVPLITLKIESNLQKISDYQGFNFNRAEMRPIRVPRLRLQCCQT